MSENTKAKYTPGPWRATGRHVVADETEDRLGMMVLIQSTGNRDDVRANLRLIAAAPDLLEALVGILPEAMANFYGGSDAFALLEAARAAIEKATKGKA